MQQAQPHLLPGASRTGLTGHQNETHPREVSSQFLGAHEEATDIAPYAAEDRSLVSLDHASGLIQAPLRWGGESGRIGEWTDHRGAKGHETVGKAKTKMGKERERVEINHRIVGGDADEKTKPLEEIEGSEKIMRGVEKRRRDVGSR